MSMNRIQIVIQSAEGGGRLEAPGEWGPSTKLSEVAASLQPRLGNSLENTALRYVQTTIPYSKWSTTSLKSIGLSNGGRALLTLQTVKSTTAPEKKAPPPSDDGKIQSAIQLLLKNNFDTDTKVCLTTLLKVLDNVLQQPGNEKVRSIRMANPAFNKKVASRKGGVEILLASGFELNRAPPPLLSTSQSGEECMVLPPEKEDTSLLVKVRRMLVTCAVNQLGMKAEELPKFKQPPRLTDPGDHAVGRKKPPASSGEFNPYQGQRYDAKSAAVGRNLGPDGNYESTTEKQLQQLQTQQAKLEKSLHKPLADRELSAILPGANKTVTATDSMDVDGPSDGSLLATRMKQMEQERRQREEGGFTTKAMRDLQQLKKQKVYSHVQLRIQFPDGSSLEAKFLPKETVATVKEVILSAFVITAFDFELYVAPPRRQLEMGSTLESEGLVPAAKVFVSWKVNRAPTKAAPVGSFMKPELFRHQAGQAFPAAQSLLESKKAAPKKKAASKEAKKSSREEDMLKRMMGGKGGLGGSNRRNTKKDDKGSGGGKPKWFRR